MLASQLVSQCKGYRKGEKTHRYVTQLKIMANFNVTFQVNFRYKAVMTRIAYKKTFQVDGHNHWRWRRWTGLYPCSH